ncbi:amino acid ABC transporter substrate-binding protein [Aquisalimonas sp. 2447]|uniref:substrate-binding periplasmic protein n=1 Tax=Aquisalimonas sp. 2447 TaxID=2740807 RepID=UPI0014323EAC|nr:transporter substrate-binding domain-containing protein [Aquisalimonas sp. 2447]QIT54974.1 amino acid ABC transporter substrate-binding protein [Aquisalimonas sp. 2447]
MVTATTRVRRGAARALAGALLWAASWSVAQSDATAPEDILWLTEEYAPYNFTEDDGTPSGITIDVLGALWDRLDADINVNDIRVVPWARGYRVAQEDPTACLGATTITDSRRDQFSFIGPYVQARNAVIGPADQADHDFGDVGDLAGMEIGVVRNDIAEELLQEAGAPVRYVRLAEPETMLRMLDGGRFDAIAYNVLVVNWTMRDLGISVDDYAELLLLDEGGMGLACHQDMNPELLQRMRSAMDEMRQDGTLEEIRARYMNGS